MDLFVFIESLIVKSTSLLFDGSCHILNVYFTVKEMLFVGAILFDLLLSMP